MKNLLLAIVLLSSSAFAQTIWHGAQPVNTGWFTPNGWGCTPLVNEPEQWSQRADVSLPPDGADVVRIVVQEVRYRANLEVTNLATQPVTYSIAGLYRFWVGHRPGLYRGGPTMGAVFLRGHGFDQSAAASAYVIQAFGGSSSALTRTLAGGASETIPYERVYGSPSNPLNTFTMTLAAHPEFYQPTRRGAHALWTTAEGDFTWTWTTPSNWTGTHSPLVYSMQREVQATYTVEYGSYP